MTQGLFGAGAVMISFGALIGKVSPHMMVMVAVCETVFYALNTYIGVYVLGASDCGGSIFIHTVRHFACLPPCLCSITSRLGRDIQFLF